VSLCTLHSSSSHHDFPSLSLFLHISIGSWYSKLNSQYFQLCSNLSRVLPSPSVARCAFSEALPTHKKLIDCIVFTRQKPFWDSLNVLPSPWTCRGGSPDLLSPYSYLGGYCKMFPLRIVFKSSLSWDHPVNLSILVTGGKENNNDSLSNAEWTGTSSMEKGPLTLTSWGFSMSSMVHLCLNGQSKTKTCGNMNQWGCKSLSLFWSRGFGCILRVRYLEIDA
jgi:hypothetical protein